MLLVLKFSSPVTHKTVEKTAFIVCGDVEIVPLEKKKKVFICQMILLSSNFRQQHLQESEAPVPSAAHQAAGTSQAKTFHQMIWRC